MLLILPIVLPLLTAILLVTLWTRPDIQRWISLGSAALQLCIAGVLVVEVSSSGILSIVVGSWPAPFGIALVSDLLSALMVSVSCLISFAVAVYSIGGIDARREAHGYYVLLNTLMVGVNGAFLTGDIFNLYVWFEVLLISSFVLAALGGEKGQLEGALKYVTLNLLSSALFLTATGVLYAVVGTLNMADLAVQLPLVKEKSIVAVLAVLFLVAFGIKAAVFPLFPWLPASYHTLPAPVAALFAGLLTKVGVYALYRMFTLVFPLVNTFTGNMMLVVAALTMMIGVLGAAAQYDLRRLLSFHIVSQIGYLVFALAIGTPLALAGGIFYTLHHIVVKSNLFLVGGVAAAMGGSHDIRKLGGFYTSTPWLAVLFLIPAFSLAGFPPLSGFWAKLAVVRAGLKAGDYLITGVAVFVGLLTIFSMAKVWAEAFWKVKPEGPAVTGELQAQGLRFMVSAIVILALCTLVLGLFSQPLFSLSERAAQQLLNPSEYINTVLRRSQ